MVTVVLPVADCVVVAVLNAVFMLATEPSIEMVDVPLAPAVTVSPVVVTFTTPAAAVSVTCTVSDLFQVVVSMKEEP